MQCTVQNGCTALLRHVFLHIRVVLLAINSIFMQEIMQLKYFSMKHENFLNSTENRHPNIHPLLPSCEHSRRKAVAEKKKKISLSESVS